MSTNQMRKIVFQQPIVAFIAALAPILGCAQSTPYISASYNLSDQAITAFSDHRLTSIEFIGSEVLNTRDFCEPGKFIQDALVYKYTAQYFEKYNVSFNFLAEDFPDSTYESHAAEYAETFGRLPEFLFNDLKEVDVANIENSNRRSIAAWPPDNVVCLPTGAFDPEESGGLVDGGQTTNDQSVEERLIHELVHVSYDLLFQMPNFSSEEQPTALQLDFYKAQNLDGSAATGYAHSQIRREDNAESLTLWTYLNFFTEKIPAGYEEHIRALIPNRLNFYDWYFLEKERLDIYTVNSTNGRVNDSGKVEMDNILVGDTFYDLTLDIVSDNQLKVIRADEAE